MTFDPKYKIKHRLPSISRLSKYQYSPPPMVGDPPNVWDTDWAKRCEAIYAHMMWMKRGGIPPALRHGVWFYAEWSQ